MEKEAKEKSSSGKKLQQIASSIDELKKLVKTKEGKTAQVDVDKKNVTITNDEVVQKLSKENIKKIKIEVVGDDDEEIIIPKISELLNKTNTNRKVVSKKTELLEKANKEIEAKKIAEREKKERQEKLQAEREKAEVEKNKMKETEAEKTAQKLVAELANKIENSERLENEKITKEIGQVEKMEKQKSAVNAKTTTSKTEMLGKFAKELAEKKGVNKPAANKTTSVANNVTVEKLDEKSDNKVAVAKNNISDNEVEKAAENVLVAPETSSQPSKVAAQQTAPKHTKVLYVVSESQPFIATGGLADVAGSLPKAIEVQDEAFDIRIVLPFYADIKPEFKEKCKKVAEFTVHLGWRQEYAGVFMLEYNNLTYYFIDNEKHFNRKGTYGHFDDGERFAYFSKAVTEMLPHIDFYPDIVHCNDWHTALVPVYLRTGFFENPAYTRIKTIYTIHNIEYQGKYGKENIVDLFGIDKKYLPQLEFAGDINLCKAAIVFSDFFTTVSRSYTEEIKGPLASHGLSSVIVAHQHKMRGIINGLDYDFYNPESDTVIYENFNAKTSEKKAINKRELQRELGLPQDNSIPIYCMATRLVYHKGLDLVKDIFDRLMALNAQFMIVGDGDEKYINFFRDKQFQYPNNVRALVGMYSNEWARKFYAGGDVLIMPSINEPCGLSQMVASRYGTVPIVREIGGLKDSILDFGYEVGGNGYTFREYNANDLFYSVERAAKDFADKENWKKKVDIVMNMDFSWKKSSREYIKLYRELHN